MRYRLWLPLGLLLSALGLRFSPTTALCVLCLSAAAGVVPITAGGLAVNVIEC